MEATAHEHEGHHEMPAEGSALTGVAISATLHCLTGCAIGEVTGMAIGTALGFSNLGTIALAVALAFLFGYSLTSLPLLRAGLALSVVIPIALASDTLSIATMEVVDNVIMVAIPGAMEAGIDSLLFWGSLSVALVVAGAFAVPVNRWLIGRGKGHAAVHETGIHGGPPVRVVAWAAAVAAVFGTVVLTVEAINDEGGGHGTGHEAAAATTHEAEGAHAGTEQEPIRGLALADDGMSLDLLTEGLGRGEPGELRFAIVGPDGAPTRDFEIEHEKRMHLIVVRRDMTGFQHLHPEMSDDGVWSTPLTLPEAGSYRVFADFSRGGESETLAADLNVDGAVDWQPLPEPGSSTVTDDGYRVELDGDRSSAGQGSELGFRVSRGGAPVQVQPYLGANGHLVALREGDLAFLHVHPMTDAEDDRTGRHGDAIRFMTEFPSEGRYRLFLQFRHEDEVHTSAFTREVSR